MSLGAALALAGCARGIPSRSSADAPAIELRNAKWFDGTGFVDRTLYVVDGVFRTAPPRSVARVVDLAGAYVVPPFAEAHNHWLEPNAVDEYVQRYLSEGVF